MAGADEERICEKTSEAELSNSALQNMELSSLSPRKIASLAEHGKKENAVAAVLQGSVSLNQWTWIYRSEPPVISLVGFFFQKQQHFFTSPAMSGQYKQWAFFHHITWLETANKDIWKDFIFFWASSPTGGGKEPSSPAWWAVWKGSVWDLMALFQYWSFSCFWQVAICFISPSHLP